LAMLRNSLAKVRVCFANADPAEVLRPERSPNGDVGSEAPLQLRSDGPPLGEWGGSRCAALTAIGSPVPCARLESVALLQRLDKITRYDLNGGDPSAPTVAGVSMSQTQRQNRRVGRVCDPQGRRREAAPEWSLAMSFRAYCLQFPRMATAGAARPNWTHVRL
jgi:hypothetical protein